MSIRSQQLSRRRLLPPPVESRIRLNGGFGETPGKLLTLEYNFLLPQRGRGPSAKISLPGKICETLSVDSKVHSSYPGVGCCPPPRRCSLRSLSSVSLSATLCRRMAAGEQYATARPPAIVLLLSFSFLVMRMLTL